MTTQNNVVDFLIWIQALSYQNIRIAKSDYTQKVDTKFVWQMVEYVISDGDDSGFSMPYSTWEWEPVERAFLLAPDSVQMKLQPLMSAWKLNVFPDKSLIKA